jgi:predicted ribosomally synthesized peptide with nif11-like leader
MSKEAVTKFLSRLAEDPALQEQARSLAKDAQDPAAAAVDLGSKQGFQFTGAEFLEVIQLAQAARGGQLSSAELERVAGGLLQNKVSYRLWDAGALFFASTYDFKTISTFKYDKI